MIPACMVRHVRQECIYNLKNQYFPANGKLSQITYYFLHGKYTNLIVQTVVAACVITVFIHTSLNVWILMGTLGEWAKDEPVKKQKEKKLKCEDFCKACFLRLTKAFYTPTKLVTGYILSSLIFMLNRGRII